TVRATPWSSADDPQRHCEGPRPRRGRGPSCFVRHNGCMLRWLTAGESHGPALVAVLEGMPAGVPMTTEVLARELARRRAGHGRGARMSFEQDEVDILGGVRHGVTLGSPISIRIGNSEWPKWDQ